MALGHVAFLCHYYFNKHWTLILWITVNIYVFWNTYSSYKMKPEYFYLRNILGKGLCISRGSAAMINLSCSLVLIPVCRAFNSWFHHALGSYSRIILTIWFTKLKTIHITIAVTIIISSLIHTGSHIMNTVNFSRHYNSQIQEINWASYKGQSPVIIILTSVVGVTGTVMLVILSIMVILSLKYVRELDYHLFWGTHFLFLIFMILFIIHPYKGVLKRQLNWKEHIPGCTWENKTDYYGNNSIENQFGVLCASEPVFEDMPTQAWIWATGPLVIYLVDLTVRMRNRNCDNTFTVESATLLPGDVTHICITSTTACAASFNSVPGQYILLQCPRLAPLEWHPFSIVDCSKKTVSNNKKEVTISLLIRIRGDWTRAICNTAITKQTNKLPNEIYQKPLRLLVDGPFFSPVENVLHSPVAICIAGGIGITPFASLLRHILKEDMKKMCQPFKVHFIWVIQNMPQLTWLLELLRALNRKLEYQNQLHRLDLQLYVTKEPNFNKTEETWPEDLQFLLEKIKPHRPNWKNLLTNWKIYYERDTIPVFLCGPLQLTREVQNVCTKLNKRREGCQFSCVVESFK